MSGPLLSAPTLFRARYRKVEKNALPRWCASAGEYSFKQEAQALARQDAVMRFLTDMDRKLDTILFLLQQTSIAEEFPGKGHILELGGSELVLECAEALRQGENLELLLMMGGYPMRMLSVMGEVGGARAMPNKVEQGNGTYAVSYACLSEEDRDSIIAFIFQEDRKRIRRQKEES